MATKKKATPPPPPPPKNVRMDIVLDPQRQEIIAQLCEKTGEKANTKAVFIACNHYLHRKPGDEKQIRDLQQELNVVKNELFTVKQNLNAYFHAESVLRESLSGKAAPVASKNNDGFASHGSFSNASKRYWCPECEEHFQKHELDETLCPECGLKLITPEGDSITYGTGDYEKYCNDCGTRLYQNINDDWFCPDCDEVKTDFED